MENKKSSNSMKFFYPFLLLLLFCFFRCCFSLTHNVGAIFQFGDSTLDAGNNFFNHNCSVQANFLPYGQDFFHRPTGRFTNGRTVGDFVSEYLGIDFQKPYLEVEMQVRNGSRKNYPSNGINFASAGSGVLMETNQKLGVTSLQLQLQQFEDLNKQNKINKESIPHAFFFLESGSNDIFQYFLVPENPRRRPTVDSYVASMLSQVEMAVSKVYQLGARRIAIFGLGPLGCIPARIGLPGGRVDQCNEEVNKMVKKFNLGLEDLIKVILPIKLRGTLGVYGSTYELVQLFCSYPAQFGFTNTSAACCGGGILRAVDQCGRGQYELCKNPDEYIFWDYFHPSEHTYKLISNAFWGGTSSWIKPINLKTLAVL